MIKYKTLLSILDRICDEAPESYLSYKPAEGDGEKLIQARSKALIHLFLKVQCGITSFKERHDLITDGSQDGGVDGYYIDREKRKLYLIQSKFRSTPQNFEEKSISADELVRMEINRILKGESTDSNGNEFNSKIKAFQEKWRNVPNPAHYDYNVIILGNLTNYNDEQIKRLIDNSSYIVYDFRKTYNNLVFPLCSGTYYDPKEIKITIDLQKKEQSTLKQKITTRYGEFQVRVVFVPAKEIGRILSKYKNSILKYNPRNYLSLSANKVNRNIRDSILSSQTNDFAILNNGITLVADSFFISETTGAVDVGQIIMTNPQIVNGGQTAYTLSKIYDLHKDALEDVFQDKEVMLKVIVLRDDIPLNLKFVEEISNATNQQSRVEEADRRANQPVQLQIQESIFNDFGYFYERKRGEFYNGIDGHYIDQNLVIDRYDFLRAYMAFKGEPRWARQRGSDTLFKEKQFNEILADGADYSNMLFSYRTLKKLSHFDDDAEESSWGYGLRYGKMAIISAIGHIGIEDQITRQNIDSLVDSSITKLKGMWLNFEAQAKTEPGNADYLTDTSFDFDNYYKGKTVDGDIKAFFSRVPKEEA